MNEGAPEVPTEKIEAIADQTISSLDPSMNAVIEERTIMPFVGNEYDDKVLRFTHASDPSMEWTMEINNTPGYVEERLPEVIQNVYQEKDIERNSPAELSDDVF